MSTNNVVKSFGSNVALNGLSLRVPNGISGFVGKNGAGKTTTISLLLGLLKPNQGEASVFGLDCWRDSYRIRRRLGVMHEVNTYPGVFTGRQLLEHVARIRGVTQVKQRVNEMLEDVGLTYVKDKTIKGYSAGMLRRLGLAQALVSNPEFVILDEPTANIDPLGRVAILEKIKHLHQEHDTGFLVSTHILSDLEKICDWLSIIDSGRIVDQGKIKDLTEKYSANTYRIEISNPKLFYDKVKTLDGVEKVWIENQVVYCKVNDMEVFCNTVPKIVVKYKLTLRGLQHTFGTLEEIYMKTASL